jgi:hypothetical protein
MIPKDDNKRMIAYFTTGSTLYSQADNMVI